MFSFSFFLHPCVISKSLLSRRKKNSPPAKITCSLVYCVSRYFLNSPASKSAFFTLLLSLSLESALFFLPEIQVHSLFVCCERAFYCPLIFSSLASQEITQACALQLNSYTSGHLQELAQLVRNKKWQPQETVSSKTVLLLLVQHRQSSELYLVSLYSWRSRVSCVSSLCLLHLLYTAIMC